MIPTQSVEHSDAGNTMSASNTVSKNGLRKRAWCITNFNDEIWHPEKAIYDLMCSDTSKDGKLHYHQYLYFKNPVAFSTIKKSYPTAHIQTEISQGAYISYIKENKNGRKTIIYEEGQAPQKHRFPTIREVKEMTHSEREDLPFQYYNCVERLNAKENNDILIDDIYKPDMKVYWITGPSNAGKTHKAIKMAKELGFDKINMVKFDGSFWHGIGTCKIAIYDDFRDSHMKPSEFINFIDYNVHPLNLKGSSEMNKYQVIIITSVQDPRFIYQGIRDVEPQKQWLRRMTIIELDEEGNELIED